MAEISAEEILSGKNPIAFLRDAERLLGEDFRLAPPTAREALREARRRAGEGNHQKEVLTWLRNAITSSQ